MNGQACSRSGARLLLSFFVQNVTATGEVKEEREPRSPKLAIPDIHTRTNDADLYQKIIYMLLTIGGRQRQGDADRCVAIATNAAHCYHSHIPSGRG